MTSGHLRDAEVEAAARGLAAVVLVAILLLREGSAAVGWQHAPAAADLVAVAPQLAYAVLVAAPADGGHRSRRGGLPGDGGLPLTHLLGCPVEAPGNVA
ncbi:hypothetical protein ACLQ24_07435 [Micromonospora sp. DT4]|uniref:hypothetical protein n=1 Tax=Micromonospora sp. DT4 TaxID=3393438 RepID=UPI003CEB1810